MFRERTGPATRVRGSSDRGGMRTAAAKTPKRALATTTGRALRAAVGRARSCTCRIERGERVSLDGDWTMISRRAGGRGARRAPRASVGSGPMAARWTRIESMEPSRVGSGSGARARARDAALARARRPQPADAVRLRFRAPEKRRGRPGAGRRGRRDGASLTLGALTTLAAAEMFMMAAILTCGCVR